MIDSTMLTNYTRQIGKTITRNSPALLTALGVGGLLATVIMAIKATPKALEALDYERDFRRLEEHDTEPLEFMDVLELTWKFYVPTILMGGTTIACMISSNHILLRRNAALASLYSITEKALHEYQEQVVEKIGEKKEAQIQEELAQKKLNDHPVDSSSIIITGKGTFPCFDMFSARYFEGDVETIRQKVNTFNQRLLREGWLNINEFYYELGLEPIELGEEFGWIAEYGMLEPRYTTKFTTDGRPCLVLDYMVKPRHI